MFGTPMSVYSVKSVALELMATLGAHISGHSSSACPQRLWRRLYRYRPVPDPGLILSSLHTPRLANNVSTAFLNPVKSMGELFRAFNQSIVSVDNRKPAGPR